MTFESLPSTIRVSLIEDCDDLERVWKSGRRPRIEDYLSARSEPERTQLLERLLRIELELRKSNGEAPQPSEYLERFQRDTHLILTVFGQPPPHHNSTELLPASPTEPDSSLGRDPVSSPPPTEPGTTIGMPDNPVRQKGQPKTLPQVSRRFQNLQYLGAGNFVVYRAHDHLHNRDVAIKIARPNDFRSSLLMSLAAEAEKHKGLNHPGIVKFYEYVPAQANDAGGGDFIVMEFIEGQTLEHQLASAALSPRRLAEIVAKVADAINYTHIQTRGLVHRDLKPSNILIDARGEPLVCDFGLAIDEKILWSRKNELAGTFRYMAPEQVRRITNRLDGRTDIWALGVILYRGLTGKFPFDGLSNDAIIEQILRRDPKPLRMSNPQINPELERITLRCLSRPMNQRYLTASDLGAELLQAINPSVPHIEDQPLLFPPKGFAPYSLEDKSFFLAMLPGPRSPTGLPESVRFWKTRIESTNPDHTFPVGLIYGPSGGGKTSFVRAALLPHLDKNRVTTLYLEATRTGAESRILAEIIRLNPSLAQVPNLSLPDALALLLDKKPDSPKLLIVLDQFEQWLQTHPRDPEAELIQALRHCDGQSLQALVLIRDDFWTASNHFFEALEVPLAQGRNQTAVELFDTPHARKILEGFGRSLGKLPETLPDDPAADMTRQFLDDAAAALTDADGRVIPIRLTLFAKVVRFRDWHPQTLVDLNGADGIGVKFLNDCFASKPLEPHKEAAQALLKQLLPPPNSAIRGAPRSAADLRAASRPADFTKLLALLERDLKLITATDQQGLPSQDQRPESYYRLAHDYLVRPIRQWLEHDQSSTPKGRAKVRLELVNASYIDRPGARRLPSPLELATILWHVPQQEYSPAEHRLITLAKRHYLLRATTALLLIVALLALGKTLLDRKEATSLVKQAVKSDYRGLPATMESLTPYHHSLLTRRLVTQTLESYELDKTTSTAKSPSERHANDLAKILLFHFAPTSERGGYLRSLLNSPIEPDQVEAITDCLAEHRQEAGIAYIDSSLNSTPATRLRVACALAKLINEIPGSYSLTQAANPLKNALLAEDRRAVTGWLKLLGPHAIVLIPPLKTDCHDPELDSAARAQAAFALVELLMLTNDIQEIVESIVQSRPDAAQILRRALASLPLPDAAVTPLHRVLNERPADADPETRKDEIASRQAAAALALASLGHADILWPLLAHQPDPRLRSIVIDTLHTSGLDLKILLDRLNIPSLDPAQRQAILLAVAETPTSAIHGSITGTFLNEASFTLFRNDPDPGVHSAAELLHRRIDNGEIFTLPPGVQPPKPTTPSSRSWRPGPNGHTFAVLPAPLEFWMGSPESEQDRENSENRHYRRIDRSIEVATKEVAAHQFRNFNPDYKPSGRSAGEPGVVANLITWIDAARYCNWLSLQAKIPESQWCYPKNLDPGAKIEASSLTKIGYRLPTEAEWEYFARAGSETSRHFGANEPLLNRHAWTWLNSIDRTHPPGLLLPNQFGLFDTLGNVKEWCQDGLDVPPGFYQLPYPAGTLENPASDSIHDIPNLTNDTWRYLRGSSYNKSPLRARSAFRNEANQDPPHPDSGFRVVRTLPKASG